MPSTSKQAIIDASAELFRRQGFAGTGLKQIATAAGLPIGSIYHHFPDGKAQLGVAVISSTGAGFEALVAVIIDAAPDVVTGIDNAFIGAADVVRSSGYADACPIATLALEVADTNEAMRAASATAFGSWIDGLSIRLIGAGAGPAEAREAALSILSLLEGAFLFSRSMRSTESLDATRKAAVALARALLDS